MKLRVRPFQSKETLKIDVPDSCTLPQFRQILSQTLPNSPLPASIRLSLNLKDDLHSDDADSLQSLGIAAGDLIYFSVEEPAPATGSNPQISLSQVTDSTLTPRSNDSISECSTRLNPHNTLPKVDNSDSVMLDSQERETLDTGSQMEAGDEDNEDNRITDGSFEVVDKSFSVPGFLRKVFAAELGDDAGRDHKLIVIAVHTVLLESGFVGFDEKAGVVVDGFQLRNEWPSGLFKVSLFYTLPESVSGEARRSSVVLKFQSLGKFMNVYGTLCNGSAKRGTYRVQLNEDELVPFLNVVWANCGVMEDITGQDGSTSPEKEVFKFWRVVKDKLALPLLIDICEEAGLELPPCFMRLPTELKLKILESLPGVDVAKVGSVCRELRYLASSDDLWKVKFDEEFSNEMKVAELGWKKAFSMAWSRRGGRRLASRVRGWPFCPVPYWSQPRGYGYSGNALIHPLPLGDECISPPPHGDDLQTMLHDPVIHPLRSFSPSCNLGVRLRGGRFH